MADENTVIVRTNSGVFYTDEFYATPVEYERPLWKDCNDGLPMGDIALWKWNIDNPIAYDWERDLLYLGIIFHETDDYGSGIWKMDGPGGTFVKKFDCDYIHTTIDAAGGPGTPLPALSDHSYQSMAIDADGNLMIMAGARRLNLPHKRVFYSTDQLATLPLGDTLHLHDSDWVTYNIGMASEHNGRSLYCIWCTDSSKAVFHARLGVSDDGGITIYDGGVLHSGDGTNEIFSVARNGDKVYFYGIGQYGAKTWCVSETGGYPFDKNLDHLPYKVYRHPLGAWADRSYVACSQLDPLKLMAIFDVSSVGTTYLSDDGGESWAATGENMGEDAVAIAATKGGGWIVTKAQTGPDGGLSPNEYIMYSADDGDSWSNQSGNIGQSGFMDETGSNQNGIFQIITEGFPFVQPGTFLSNVALEVPGTTGTFLMDVTLGAL